MPTTKLGVVEQSTTTLAMARDHLFKILDTATKANDADKSHLLDELLLKTAEPEYTEESRDHLLNVPAEPVEHNFIGSVFGLVYNQFR